MIAVMQIFIVREIQLFKVKKSLIFLTNQGSGEVLTRIMHFIKPHMHESRNSSKL